MNVCVIISSRAGRGNRDKCGLHPIKPLSKGGPGVQTDSGDVWEICLGKFPITAVDSFTLATKSNLQSSVWIFQ